jgi:hypothetical protein
MIVDLSICCLTNLLRGQNMEASETKDEVT